jgi:hypothetical protein
MLLNIWKEVMKRQDDCFRTCRLYIGRARSSTDCGTLSYCLTKSPEGNKVSQTNFWGMVTLNPPLTKLPRPEEEVSIVSQILSNNQLYRRTHQWVIFHHININLVRRNFALESVCYLWNTGWLAIIWILFMTSNLYNSETNPQEEYMQRILRCKTCISSYQSPGLLVLQWPVAYKNKWKKKIFYHLQQGV